MSLAETASDIDHLGEEERNCLENCFAATEVCEWCADECLDEEEDMSRCIRLCRDVADVASLHARFMARDSTYSGALAEVCAALCEECGEVCEQYDHEHCQTCAEVLRECAESCRTMAGA